MKRRSRGEVEKGRHWACLRGGFIALNPRNRALKSARGPAKTDLEGPNDPHNRDVLTLGFSLPEEWEWVQDSKSNSKHPVWNSLSNKARKNLEDMTRL